MRNFSWLIFGAGCFLLWSSVEAQDARPPASLQLILGADGSIKIIDAKTGKPIASDILIQANKKASDAQDQARKALEAARKELEKLLREPKKADAQPLQIELELQIAPKPGEQPKIIKIEKVQSAGSLDKKLDLILKQLEGLRRDVDGIKKKLDGKQPDNIRGRGVPPAPKDAKDKKPDEAPRFLFRFEPAKEKAQEKKPEKKPEGGLQFQIVPAPTPGKDKTTKAIDPEVLKRLDKLIQELEAKQRPAPPPAADPSGLIEIQRQLERLIRQVEELERKNRKR